MKHYEYIRALVVRLLDESPITSEEVIGDVHHLLSVGEEELAFYTMCSWLYEDELSISREFYHKLNLAAGEIGRIAGRDPMRGIDELIIE